ncbi:MAG: hypothetical protein ABL994_24780, partial [Verrucomicrobiales bacterium]
MADPFPVGIKVEFNELAFKHFEIATVLPVIIQEQGFVELLGESFSYVGEDFLVAPAVLNQGNLKLPFWLFNLEEFVDVIFGGRPGVPE